MKIKNYHSGKCDLKNQTSDKVFIFMNSEDKNGFGLFLFKDTLLESGFRKDMKKNILYSNFLLILDSFENCIGAKFIPYGYDIELDKDVENMKDNF